MYGNQRVREKDTPEKVRNRNHINPITPLLPSFEPCAYLEFAIQLDMEDQDEITTFLEQVCVKL